MRADKRAPNAQTDRVVAMETSTSQLDEVKAATALKESRNQAPPVVV